MSTINSVLPPRNFIVSPEAQKAHAAAYPTANANQTAVLSSYKNFILKPNFDLVQKVQTSNTPEKTNIIELAQNAVNEIILRKNKSGQRLDWIGNLQKNQLENLDGIYEKAEKAKEGGFTDIAVLGIGGSRNPIEAMTKIFNKTAKVHFYSGIDNESFNRFASNLDLDKTKFLVISRSGGTLETNVAYEKAKKLLQNKLGKDDVSERFIAVTDKSEDKSKLRKKVNAGEFQLSLVTHDDVGGGFSIFDDATLFTLAYSGIKKNTLKNMLETSIKIQEKFLAPDVEKNEALKLAVSDVEAIEKGNKNHFVYYFGDEFEGLALWEKQLKNEALKSSVYTDTNIAPAVLHYNTDSDLDVKKDNSFYTFVFVKPETKEEKALIDGAFKAYKNAHHTTKIELEELSPEEIVKFIELKHFETLYAANILRQKAGVEVSENEMLPELNQANVNIYKKEVKNILAD